MVPAHTDDAILEAGQATSMQESVQKHHNICLTPASSVTKLRNQLYCTFQRQHLQGILDFWNKAFR